jgi:hypothetical protein
LVLLCTSSDDAYTQGHDVPWHPIYDHSAGAIVIACTNDELSPAMFAAIGDNATDDWRALQKFFQLTSGFTVFGGSPVNKYKSNRPFVVLEHSHMKEFAIRFDVATFDANCIQASIPDNNGGGNNGNWGVSESQALFAVASPGTRNCSDERRYDPHEQPCEICGRDQQPVSASAS